MGAAMGHLLGMSLTKQRRLGLGEDGEVEEDEALLHGGLPLHAGPLRAADHRYNK